MRTRRFLLGFCSFLVFSSCAIWQQPTSQQELKQEKPRTSDELTSGRSQTGYASFYGASFHGKPTASGEMFDRHKLTAAHRSYPFGTKVKVRNIKNGRAVTVRINDRGPFVRGRIIDLSEAAANRLGMAQHGVVRVEVTPITSSN